MNKHGNFDFSKVTIYLVGGAVRDYFMGIEPKDKDYVVVGSSPEEMVSLGFKKVGADFPVFLHPETKEEYALARTERKTSNGYQGFECEWKGVTIEEDLSRRDLTINAMAKNIETGEIVDICNGLGDLQEKVLHPTSEAFLEDPIRCLRAARFLSRYTDFKPSYGLYSMCIDASKELKFVSKERIWLETQKALEEQTPSKYFNFIDKFPVVFGEVFNLKVVNGKNEYHQEANAYVHTMMVIDYAAKHFNDVEITFAGLMHDLGKVITWNERNNCHGHEEAGIPVVEEFCKNYKVPNNFRDLALIATKQHLKVHNILGRGKNKAVRPKSIMKLFEDTSALSKPERFKKMLKVCECDAKGRIGIAASEDYIQRQYLEECLEVVLSLDTKNISAKLLSEGKEGLFIGEQIRIARINEIRNVKNKWSKNNGK